MYIDICISSANVGFGKPDPKIFHLALEITSNPGTVWMSGDNLKADIRGEEAVGIKAILVRKSTSEPAEYFSPDLKGVIDLIQEREGYL